MHVFMYGPRQNRLGSCFYIQDKPTPSVENDHHVISLLSDSDVLSDSDETDVEAEVDALFNSDDGEATV